MPIQPIAAPRLYERIADAIGTLIDAGEFAPGARLPGERELARRLRVSRTSLREALSALELAGRVDIRMGSGVYVRAARAKRPSRLRGAPKSEASPFDVLHARQVVEAETAALAARNATTAQVAGIAEAFDRLAADMRANRARSEGDRLFHLRIAEAGGNGALAAIVRDLWEAHRRPLDARLEALFVTLERRRDNIAEHRAILDAIRARDPVAARGAMRRHLQNAQRQRLALLRERAPRRRGPPA